MAPWKPQQKPKNPVPWAPNHIDENADEKHWPHGFGPDGELNIVDEKKDEEESSADE
jgi:hypothetical protein